MYIEIAITIGATTYLADFKAVFQKSNPLSLAGILFTVILLFYINTLILKR